MRSMSKEEEKSISAYVRLSFDNWYQGYKDHISKYLKDNKNHLYTILENVKEKNEGENVIKVNASHFIKNEELRECIDEALQFLEVREEYSIGQYNGSDFVCRLRPRIGR